MIMCAPRTWELTYFLLEALLALDGVIDPGLL
jgi:hypothetical protein